MMSNKNNTLIVCWILCLVFIVVIILSYCLKFGEYGISNNPDRWGTFGDYFGGLLNPILALLNLIILTYLSLKLVSIEDERNKHTIQELAKPYAELDYNKGLSTLKIELHNLGLGPMIINKVSINDLEGNTYSNFKSLISSLKFSPAEGLLSYETSIEQIKIRSFNVSNNRAAVKKEGKVVLFKVVGDDTELYKQYLEFLKKILSKYSLTIEYMDMYNNKMPLLKEQINFEF